MAWTIAVVRDGLQRSLASSFHVFRVATARSPRARMRAWALFTAFCRADSFGRYRWRLNGVRTLPPAPWVSLVREGHHLGAGQRGDDAVQAGAAVRSCVEPGSAAEAQTSRPAASAMTCTFIP